MLCPSEFTSFRIPNFWGTYSSSQSVLKTCWRIVNKTNFSWVIRLEDVVTRPIYLQRYVLKMSWTRLEDAFWRPITKANIFVLMKTYWRRLLKAKAKNVFKTSSPRRMFCWDVCLRTVKSSFLRYVFTAKSFKRFHIPIWFPLLCISLFKEIFGRKNIQSCPT